jgi:hypothetical protein
MNNIFNILRILLILFSISVWHSFANEKMSAGTLEVNTCRLFESDLFLTVLLVHFSMICISFAFLKRQLNLYFATINILFGAFIVMSIKPPTWFLSFEWSDCYDLYDDNNGISKLAMLSYVLITTGAIELIELFTGLDNSLQMFRCVEKRAGLSFSWVHTIILAVFGAIFFGICVLIRSLAVD